GTSQEEAAMAGNWGEEGNLLPRFSHRPVLQLAPAAGALPVLLPLGSADFVEHSSMAPLRILLLLSIAVATASLGVAQEGSFTHAGVKSDAKRYEAYLKANLLSGNKSARELRAEADKLLKAGSDPRLAARQLAQAVAADPNHAEAWIALSRTLLAIKPEQGSERYDLPVNASGAAWIAYERAETSAAKAAALVVLHEALKRR